MFSGILSIFSVLKELIGFVKLLFSWVAKQKEIELEKRRQAREKASQDLASAKTQEEILDAQKRLTDNSF